MSLPGFTASNSLLTSSGRYRASSVVRGGSHSAIESQLRAGGGSAGDTADDCVDTYQDCYIGCSVSYPESADSQDNLNAMMREGCFDSCEATFDLCSSAARFGGGIGRVARIAAPIARSTG